MGDLEMIIPAETIEAYRNTRYDVFDGDNTISLRIGESCKPLSDLYRRLIFSHPFLLPLGIPLATFWLTRLTSKPTID